MGKKWLTLAKEVLATEIEGINSVANNLDENFINAVELLGACKGRVAVCGLGKSGLVGRKIAATLSSTGTASFFLHPVEGAHGDLGALRSYDVILAISNSGETLELNAILPSLKTIGCPIIALTGNINSTLAKAADIALSIKVEREACPLNLAPTSSTTATLALGDALAVCLINLKAFTVSDFKKVHPGGALGQRLKLKTKELMHSENLPLTTSLCPQGKALKILDRGGFGTVLIVNENSQLEGIITDGDIRRALLKNIFKPSNPCAEIMIKNPCTAHKDQEAAELLELMEKKTITTLPVVDENKEILGLIHLHDLLGKGKINFT